MIRLWLEVYDPTYTTQVNNGVVELVSAVVDRVLDGIGSVSVISSPLHRDFTKRPIEMLTEKRVCEVWYQEEPEAPRKVGTFVIEDVKYVPQANGLQVIGPDVMSLLSNYTTGLALTYDATTVQDVIIDVNDIAGWTESFDTLDGNITARFDGVTVLEAIQAVAEVHGHHFRLHATTHKSIYYGDLGDDSGYRIVKIEGDKPAAARDPSVIPLESIEISGSSSEVVNKIYPLSAGAGDGRGDLEKSTRTSPYTIQTETINSRTHYYLEDSVSVALYGEIARILNFSKIAPIGTSSASRQRTANQLYDAAVAWLERRKDPLQELKVRVLQQRVNLEVGDKVRVEYVDQVNVAGTPVTLKDINDLYWVMSVRESYGADGENAVLELTNIDRTPVSVGEKIVNAVGGIDIQETGYKTTYNIWGKGPYEDWVSSSKLPSFVLTIPDDVLEVQNVTMIIHTEQSRQETISSVPTNVTLASFEPNALYPYELDMSVNGTGVVTDLGANSATAVVAEEVDITDEILGAGNDGRGNHTIAVTDASGHGLLSLQFELRGLIVPGKVV